MKYTSILIFMFAIVLSSTSAANAPGGIVKSIQTAVSKSNYQTNSLINTLKGIDTTPSLYFNLINDVDQINWNLLNQNLIYALTAVSPPNSGIKPFFNWIQSNIVPIYPNLNQTINAFYSVINDLFPVDTNNNLIGNTQSTAFGAYLLLANYNINYNFVIFLNSQAPTPNSLYVLYAILQTPSTYNSLNPYISVMAMKKLCPVNCKSTVYGPFGPFNNNDNLVKIINS